MQNTAIFKFGELGKITGGQDGTIWNDYIFRFDHKGFCTVLDFNKKEKVSEFYLDQIDKIIPHSNTVCFGSYRYDESDEFPLLYTNVYNTYQNENDKHEGLCCVYRIKRDGTEFSTELLQIIKIGFTDVKGLWKSDHVKDIRPYGNFIVDSKNNKLYVYTMLDEKMITRFFEFQLPTVNKNFEKITLNENDITTSFDTDYIYFMQGSVFAKGKIIIGQGFTNDRPAIRVIDIKKRQEISKVMLSEYGLVNEPEFLAYYNDKIYYSDNEGNFYEINLSCI